MILRILASIILILSMLFMPFWVSVFLALICMVYFDIFLEAVVIFLLSDLLYGVKEVRFFNIVFIAFIISVVALITVELIKKKLKFYPRPR